ncbi:MAG: phosphoribosylformylglycinamidine synthase subunit PurS [Nitrospira sp. SB0666_bin_27]|nr:phosphoribosylformylglycinamidine synthase subunit PurS [Nitrospira sp. SB0666_bin_27]MYF25431.1 phosphoribosylformylglycinamidine synthase subunit PurS [Nitrospira sp. SB0678_bin_10]
MRARIHVTLKSGILDPQGRTIRQSLETLGFAGVTDVRVGKFLEIELDQDDTAQAEAQLKAMCETLLANTVIEEYRYELETQPSRPSA